MKSEKNGLHVFEQDGFGRLIFRLYERADQGLPIGNQILPSQWNVFFLILHGNIWLNPVRVISNKRMAIHEGHVSWLTYLYTTIMSTGKLFF
jgi:hypothetical protein